MCLVHMYCESSLPTAKYSKRLLNYQSPGVVGGGGRLLNYLLALGRITNATFLVHGTLGRSLIHRLTNIAKLHS